MMRTWIHAARPKTLTASLVPVIMGSALAFSFSQFNLLLSVFAFCSAACIQIGTNFFNDAIDFLKGTDTEARIGPKRITQSGEASAKAVFLAAALVYLLALVFALPLIIKGGLPLLLIGIFSLLMGYAYTGGPYPLSYKGVGEIFVLLFFGLIAVSAVVYLQTQQWKGLAFLAGLQVGSLSTVLLAVNNLRDVEGDAKSGRKTFPIRFGIRAAKLEIIFFLLLPFFLLFFWENPWLRLCWLSFPLAAFLALHVWKTPPSPRYNLFLGLAALLHLLFGLLFSGGLLLS